MAVAMPHLVQCELLYFVANSFDCHPAAVIKTTITSFFREDEILLAKQILVQDVEKLVGVDIHQFAKKRIGDNKVRTCVEDILGIFATVDESGHRNSISIYCAVDKTRVPVLKDELSDIAAIRLELKRLYDKIEMLSDQFKARVETNVEPDVAPVTLATTDNAAISNGSTVPSKAVVLPTALPAVDGSATKSFAELAADMEGFQPVVQKSNIRKNKKKLVVGTGHPQREFPFKGVAKKSVLCVSRLEPGTTSSMVSDYLKKVGVDIISCYDLNSSTVNSQRYNAVRLCVPQCHIKFVMNPDMWPPGVVVQPWKFKARVGGQMNNSVDMVDNQAEQNEVAA